MLQTLRAGGTRLRVLSVENYDGTDLCAMAPTLAREGVAVDTVRPFRGERLPAADGFDAMIVLGGAQNALDDENFPYFPALVDRIRAFHGSGRPVLGVCLGAQLMARAFGGANLLGQGLEFGYVPVSPTAAARDDPLFSTLDGSLPVFQWHTDTFKAPPDACQVARGSAFEMQAFRFGAASYAVQFHFEADAGLIARWTASGAPFLDQHAPGWRDQLPAEIAEHEARAVAFCERFTSRWVGVIASAQARRAQEPAT